MKKRFLLLLCALLALPVFASAEDVLMLSGAALNAAQTIAADDSLIITETITDEEGTSVTVLSHRLNDLRQEVFTLLDEDGTLTQLRPDYGFRLAPDSANPETLVIMPDVLAETRESLRGQLALFDDEETYLFVRQPDGTLTAVTSYALDGETLAETYRISAETHTLVYYAAEARNVYRVRSARRHQFFRRAFSKRGRRRNVLPSSGFHRRHGNDPLDSAESRRGLFGRRGG